MAAVLLLAATPAVAQLPDMTPRSPAQAEQEQRMLGPGFEQQLRTNPQLYPFPPPPPAAAPIPPAPRPAPLPQSPLSAPIPPEPHLHSHTLVKPAPPLPKKKPAPADAGQAPQAAPEEEKPAP
jgi:hypothetical protein